MRAPPTATTSPTPTETALSSARRLLLLSNSRNPAGEFLVHPHHEIRALLGESVGRVLFVPFASVVAGWDHYATIAGAALGEMGYALDAIHRSDDPVAAVRSAECLLVGGGNTFHLLAKLYEGRLLEAIRARVAEGVPYIGWSAGAVVAAPTIRTTNDMPIVEPPSLAALGLVPFQINAHYTDFHPPGFQGETRAQRLSEFIEVNPGVRVVGLPEGTMLRVEGDDVALIGGEPARVFERGREVRTVKPGEDLSFLLG